MTAAELARAHRKRAALVEREFRRTSRGLSRDVVKFSRELMTKGIYAIPEDLTREGQQRQQAGKTVRRKDKLWRRTGNLRRAERAEVVDAYTVRVINDAVYAKRREAASGSAPRGKKAAGEVHYINPKRECHWREELKKVFQPRLLGLYEATIKRILEAS